MQPTQINLCQKQKNFSGLFCEFLKSTLNFQHFQEKLTLIAYVFHFRPRHTWLDKCL